MNGKCLGSDLRNSIVDDILAAGGDPETGYFPGEFKAIADKFKISNSTVRNLWDLFCSSKTTIPHPQGGGNPSHLSPEDLKLIEVLVLTNPSVSLRELHVELENHRDIYGGTSLPALSRALHRRMVSGKEYTRKKITTVANECFNDENMIYTQLFMNYLNQKDPSTLLFFDEAGFKLPAGFKCTHGHAQGRKMCRNVALPRGSKYNIKFIGWIRWS